MNKLARATGLTSCSVANEDCCQFNSDTESYQNVWVLEANGATDTLWTIDRNELNTLLNEKWGVEVCEALLLRCLARSG